MAGGKENGLGPKGAPEGLLSEVAKRQDRRIGRYPSSNEWKRLLRPIPLWAVVLLVVLLYGRLVILAVWHWAFA